jgi:hypothetical protein
MHMSRAESFFVTIATDNSAFEGSPESEIARILRALADRLERSCTPERGEPWALWDMNGNKVGEADMREVAHNVK